MTEGWVPNNEELTQCVLLIQALRDPTRSDHKMALSALNQSRGNPSTVLHILHVFARGGAYESMGLSPDLRQLAGLVIKNYTFPQLPHLPPAVQQMLKQEMLHALADPQSDIRNTAGILIGRISESFMIDTWADLLPPLYLMLDYKQHGSLSLVDGALQAVRRMCEDSVEKLSMDSVRKPLDVILPKLIALLGCNDEMVKLRALETINSTLFLLASASAAASRRPLSPSSNEIANRVAHGKLPSPSVNSRKSYENGANGTSNGNGHQSIGSGTQALVANMNAFLLALSALSSDTSARVRKAVCQAIILLATVQLSILEPMFGSICTFMLKGVLDEDEGVAMEACEFWSALSDDNDAHGVLQSHLATLIPSLISRLQLKEEQILQERIEEEAHASGEKEINFKPIHRRGRKESQDSEEEEEVVSAKWTLRKQAALVLDNLAVTFSAALVLPHALAAIQLKLQAGAGGSGNAEVWVRESGMLALGALSTGCLVEMGQYLPQLFPFLIQNLADPTPEMRSIACWVLSRYCSWIFEDEQVQMEGASDRYFVQLLEALLGIMLDPKPKVQTACCSALCTLIEVAGPDPVTPYLPQLLSYVQKAFEIYGVKSSLILVDTIGTIADIVGDALADRTLVSLYFPQLMEKFFDLEDDDMRLFPILECLTSVVAASGLESQPYAHKLYFRCLRIIGNTMAANAVADAKAAASALKNGYNTSLNSTTSSGSSEGTHDGDADVNDDDVPAKDFAICALDVLSGLCEGLESNFAVLAESNRDTLLKLMLTCLQDSFPELRQSAFALTGDLSKNCVQFISPIAPQLIDIILRNLDFDYPMVCNNASWTVGELAIKVGGGAMAPYIPRLMHSFIQILHEKDIPTTLTENVAITVGRLGVTNTAHLADHLSEYLEVWCMALRLTRQSHEKDHAFAGLIALINANPSVLYSPSSVTVPNAFFVACSSWEDPPDEPLLSQLSRILRTYKDMQEIRLLFKRLGAMLTSRSRTVSC